MVLLVSVPQVLALFLQLLSGGGGGQSTPAFLAGWQDEGLVYPEAQGPAKHCLCLALHKACRFSICISFKNCFKCFLML